MRIRWLITASLLGTVSAVPIVGASGTRPRGGEPPVTKAGEGRLPIVPTNNAQSDNTPAYFKTGLLDLETRIWAQTQIERVFYNHRIWPKENPGPKPPFEQMVPAAVIEAKVTDSLKKSVALDKFWQHPVTGEMLQAELVRMAKQTRDPATLKELFEALHNDPHLIAESLARETLADRLIHNWYANDTRFHAAARAKAEAAAAEWNSYLAFENGKNSRDQFFTSPPLGGEVAARSDAGEGAVRNRTAHEFERPFVSNLPLTLPSLPEGGEGIARKYGGEYHHTVYILDETADRDLRRPGQSPDERRVDAEEFASLKKRYSALMTSPPLGWGVPGSKSASEVQRDWEDAQRPIAGPVVGAARSAAPGEGADRYLRADRFNPLRDPDRPLTLPSPPEWGEGKISETPDHFILTRVVAVTDSRIETESISIDKFSFSKWWEGESANLNLESLSPVHFHLFTLHVSGFLNSPGCNVWNGNVNQPPPSGRYLHSAIWTGSEMIVWGGYNGTYFNSGGRYNPATDSWLVTATDANAPFSRSDNTAVWTGNEMIVWGGNNAGALNTGGRYNPVSDSWLATSTNLNVPVARYDHSAVWANGEMIVWGGGSGSGSLNTGGRYNPMSDSWMPTSIGANVPVARYHHSAIWTNNEMIIWGGNSGSGYLNSGARYQPATDIWMATSIGVNSPVARFFHSAWWTGGEMIIWGGSNGSGNLNTGGRYNPSTDSWSTTGMDSNTPTARSGYSAVWTGSKFIVWGGSNGSGYLNSGAMYDPMTDGWLSTSTGGNDPTARSIHSAVWTGTEMIVWGGYNGAYLNTGGRYNPSLGSWLPISSGASIPTGRQLFVSVWTGNEMIIWGGYNGAPLSTGGRYTPALDNWQSTGSGVNLPTPRYGHNGLWTGSDLIVWGGTDGIAPFNNGGRYNPTGDSWLSTSIGTNVPAARKFHEGVWTGNVMIIWGGNYGGNTGGLYNPANDSWLPTSTGANVPVLRQNNSAIWTGSEMIIWGGADFGGRYLNNGGRYNPISDSWQPTSTGANVPVGRLRHSAVWTGTEMIVWGGINGYSSGGRYNPSTDSWLRTSTGTNVPFQRYHHTALWSGTAMIIWGGYGGSIMNTGGHYTPDNDSWLPTSIGANVPSAREYQRAVWTGNDMLVWSGYDAYGATQTGGIYTPGSAPSPGNSLRGGKSTAINLNWSSIYGVGSYNVKRCAPTTTGCTPGTIVSTPTINQYSEPDDGLSHFYAVEAVNQCGATP